MKRGILAMTAVALLLPITAEAQWVFVARKAAQRIHLMTEGGIGAQPGYDLARCRRAERKSSDEAGHPGDDGGGAAAADHSRGAVGVRGTQGRAAHPSHD